MFDPLVAEHYMAMATLSNLLPNPHLSNYTRSPTFIEIQVAIHSESTVKDLGDRVQPHRVYKNKDINSPTHDATLQSRLLACALLIART